MATKTKNEKLYNYLAKPGKRITATEALTRFQVKNLRARISDLRNTYNWEISSVPNRKNPKAVTYKVERVGMLLA